MNNFNFFRPTDFYFGRDVELETGKVCKKYGASKVLIHFGGKSAVRSGLIDRLKESLKGEGIDYIELGGVSPNPRADLVYQGIALCKKEGVDLILAVGGGSVIDSAKAIAVGVIYEGDFWDFFDGQAIPKDALPLGVVLTIAAAGSEGSNSCVIDKTVNGIVKKKSCNCQANVPKFAIMDPKLTMTLPPYQTACGAADIMCHVMERYFTNTRDVDLTDALCEGILRTMVAMFPRVMKNPDDYEARANVMWASTLAHNNLCGVDREGDWASHRIEHELSAMYDCAHGAGLSVIFPAWMEYVLDHDVMRFAQFANRVFGCPMDFFNPKATALNGIAALRNLWGQAGLPLSFKELGASIDDIPKLLDNLGDETHTEGHFVILRRNDIKEIFNIAATYGDND